MHHNSPNICLPLTLKLTTKNGEMPFVPLSENSFQQTRCIRHTNRYKQLILIYLHLYFHQTLIPSQPQQNKKYLVFSRDLRVHLAKGATINYSTSPKSHVKHITYMNIDNGFDLLVAVIFAMSTQLGGLGPKYQDLVISFCLG